MRRTNRSPKPFALAPAAARAAGPVGPAVVFGACFVAVTLAAGGCGTDSCKSADLDCFLHHLSVFSQSGDKTDLTFVPAGKLQPLHAGSVSHGSGGPTGPSAGSSSSGAGATGATGGTGGAGGFSSSTPAITNRVAALHISDPETLGDVEIDWQDPFNCQPAFCFRTCTPGPAAAATCSSEFACTASQSDGQHSGQWKEAMGFIAAVSDAEAVFTLGVTPVSSAQCSQVVDQIKSGGGAVAGDEVAIATTLAASSGTGGEVCSAPTSCTGCTMSACTDGTSCRYLASDGTSFPCSDCKSCDSAGAQILQHCCPAQDGVGTSTSSGSTGTGGPPANGTSTSSGSTGTGTP